jgi:polysaccharide pyruvyl transferase CsaB
MKTAILSGYFGYRNLGDELILHYVSNLLKGLGYERIIALTGDIEYSKARHQGIEFVDKRDIHTIEGHVKSCSITALAGGGLFQEYNTISASEYLNNPFDGVTSYINLPLLSRIYKKPCYYLFQGIGPFFSDAGRSFAEFAYSLSNLTLTRDGHSLEVLKGLGIENLVLSADPVFLHPLNNEKKAKGLKVAVCLRKWIDDDFEMRLIDAVTYLINNFYRDYEFHFVSFQELEKGFKDSDVYENIKKGLKGEVQTKFLNTDQYGLAEAEEVFATYDMVIGMRYHSVLLAIKYGIPFIAINYWDKVKNISEEIGLSDLVIEKQDLTGKRLRAIFKEVISKYDKIRDTINIERRLLYRRLHTSIDLLRDKLSEEKYVIFDGIQREYPLLSQKNEPYLANWIRYKDYQEQIKKEFALKIFSEATLKRILKDCEANKVLIYPSLITWDTTFFQRPHQIVREFARRGYKVFFITPDPIHDKALPINQIEDNLFLINSVNLLSPLRDEPVMILITWTMNIVYKSLFPNSLVIYDWLDHLEVFKEYYCPLMELDHLKLLKSADVVAVTSDALLKETKEIRDDATLVPNGVRVEDFVPDIEYIIPEDLRPIKDMHKPIVGYYGLFALWRFDYDLVNHLTANMKDVNFVFIGLSDDDSQRYFQQRENLFILPPKRYKELKNYMQSFDAGIIPYKTDRITETIFPNKLCEFLAMGIPVVTSDLPACQRLQTVLQAKTYNEFVKALYRAIELSKDVGFKKLIMQEATNNSWQVRVDKIIEVISSSSKRRYEMDPHVLRQECDIFNTTIDLLLSKNKSLFEDFKGAILERDKTWFQLNRVIEEKGHVSYLLEQTRSELAKTKTELDETKTELAKTKTELAKTKTKTELDETKSELADSQTRLYLLQHEYESLRHNYWLIINSKTWRLGQFIGRIIGVESPWRKTLKRLFKKDTNTAPLSSESPLEDTNKKESPLEIKKTYPVGMFAGSLYDVFIFSMIDFSFRYQRPQQLASYLSKKGHRVFYMNITQFLHPDNERDFEVKELGNNLWEVFLKSPRSLDIYGGNLDSQCVETITKSINGLRRSFNMTTTVAIVHNPFWTPVALCFKENHQWKVIYDCLDEWDTFTSIGKFFLEQERQLVQKCDILTVTADKLSKKWKEHNKEALIVRNACDYEFFSKASDNELLRDIKRPIIGFFGGIADWVEIEYIAYAANKHKEWNFVLLGGIFTDISSIEKLLNVHLLGNQPYHLMRDYLYHFDVCLIPFKKNKITEAVDPVKLYEYFSLGKPVVARNLYEIRFYEELLYLFDSAEEFVEAIKKALNESSQDIKKKRIRIASTNTWSDRIDQIDKVIKDRTPMASIIIVTYNNLGYNKLCINSIVTKTDYPAYEVIVVDNNSTDGTRDYLRSITDNRIKVILNDNNEGFARANNMALKEAKGQYIIFLNNDTVVTKGWLTKLVSYLDKYPEIGLIGPVTNFCGNEAKIVLPYQDIDDMDACAYEYTSKNEGKFFDIHMLALYCAGLRRETFEKVGYLDENFGIGMFEDDDFSHRIKLQGLRVVCAEDIFIHHFGQGAFKKLIDDGSYNALFEKNREYFERKWNIKWKAHVHRQ